MSWTGRAEDQQCCAGEAGPVRPAEPLARLLHDRLDIPAKARFKREELQPQTNRPYSNTCSDQDGCSVERCEAMSDDELRVRAAARAAEKAGRVTRGAVVGVANALRAIRIEDKPDAQVVFIYDDPVPPASPLHAVVRVDETLRSDFVDIRDQIVKAFDRVVTP